MMDHGANTRNLPTVLCIPSWRGEVMLALMRLSMMLLAMMLPRLSLVGAQAAQSQVERGKYLATLGACSDCHTPGTFLGHPDMGRYLGGSDVGFAIPNLG